MNFYHFFKKLGLSLQQKEDWIESFLPTEVFLNKYKNDIENLRIGCSYSPEYLEEVVKNYTPETQIKAIRFVTRELHIKEIRLGIRWNRVEKEKGKIDFSYYKPIFDYCLAQDISICLNIGPIKTFRWPEQHIPDWVFKEIKNLPRKGSKLNEKSELGKYATNYTENLLKYLKKQYSQRQLQKITSIQVENESFHKFGKYAWRMQDSYILKLIAKVHEFFPGVGILLNSSETKNLHQIRTLFQYLRNEVKFKGRLISGFNYYYNGPQGRYIPFFGKLDSISRSQIARRNLCKVNVEFSQKVKYEIEISEAQMEPWLPITSPGNSAQEFRYLLIRCITQILDISKPSIIRIWGVERLFKAFYEKTATSEHKEIVEIIKSINRGVKTSN